MVNWRSVMTDKEPRDPSRNRKHHLPEIHSVLRATATAAAGGTLVIWWPAFTFGAYNAIFFDDVLALWAVATSVLLTGLVLRRRVTVPWRGKFNDLFLTCADFDVSGNNTPPGCAQGPPFHLR